MSAPTAPSQETIEQAELALVDAEVDLLNHPDHPKAWAELHSAREWVRQVHAASLSPGRYSEAMSALYALHIERAALAINAAMDLDAQQAIRADEDQVEHAAWDAIADAATAPR